MHDIWCKIGERFAQSWAGQAQFKMAVARHRHTAGTHYRKSAEVVGAVAWGDHHGIVRSRLEMLQQAHD